MFDCLRLKLCPGNPISLYFSAQCSKEVLCINDPDEWLPLTLYGKSSYIRSAKQHGLPLSSNFDSQLDSSGLAMRVSSPIGFVGPNNKKDRTF
jgi:hypothetical protein